MASPLYLVLSGVGAQDPLEAPQNWAMVPLNTRAEVKEEVARSESMGAETVIIFKRKVTNDGTVYVVEPHGLD